MQPANKVTAERRDTPTQEPEKLTVFDLEELLRELANECQSDATHGSIRLLFDTDTGLHSPLLGKPVALHLTLARLLKSTCARSQPGKVVLTVRASELDTQRVTVTFKIEDSASDSHQTTTTSQKEASLADETLRLAHQSARLLGTELEIFGNQAPGKGQLIQFKISCEKNLVQAKARPGAGATGKDLTLPLGKVVQTVIIEPDDLSRKVFKRMMGGLGCSVQTAVTLQEAAAFIRGIAFQKGQHLVLVFHQDLKTSQAESDWKNLYEALESDAIKKVQISLVQLVNHTTLLSAAALPYSGIQAWPMQTLALPQTQGQLAELIQVITRAEPDVKQANTLRAPLLGGLRLLVVEDDPINQFLALTLLENEGASVRVAGHGQQCLDMLHVSPQAFDLVLMDLEMPVLTGLETCRHIRSSPDLRHLPLVAVTGHDLEATRVECLQAGFDDCLNKPLDVEILRNTVLKYAKKPRTYAAIQPQAKSTQQGATEAAILDIALALSRMGGDINIFRSVAPQFPQHALDLHAQAIAYLTAGDIKSCARALHSLKSVAGTMGASALTQACIEAENIATRAQFDVQETAQAIDAINRILATTIEALARWEDEALK
ncbi:MAG: hypothetical protein RL459_1467 [Pseudomonadota bacterium]